MLKVCDLSKWSTSVIRKGRLWVYRGCRIWTCSCWVWMFLNSKTYFEMIQWNLCGQRLKGQSCPNRMDQTLFFNTDLNRENSHLENAGNFCNSCSWALVYKRVLFDCSDMSSAIFKQEVHHQLFTSSVWNYCPYHQSPVLW